MNWYPVRQGGNYSFIPVHVNTKPGDTRTARFCRNKKMCKGKTKRKNKLLHCFAFKVLCINGSNIKLLKAMRMSEYNGTTIFKTHYPLVGADLLNVKCPLPFKVNNLPVPEQSGYKKAFVFLLRN